MRILTVTNWPIRTKPQALNYALATLDAEFVTIYDAEDRPHPDQQFEALAAFEAYGTRLGCLQSPLITSQWNTWISRHFQAEYAAQFLILLPFYELYKLPFPMGGTSNHIRMEALRTYGGWDSHNVTEDADLAFRLSRFGYDIRTLSFPTLESQPETLVQWLPQRTRWLKGFCQTLLTHSRNLRPDLWRNYLAMLLSLGLSLISALAYGPALVIVISDILLSGMYSKLPVWRLTDLLLLIVRTIIGIVALNEGIKRQGGHMSFWELCLIPLYWSLGVLAGIFAIYQLLTKPFHWDKTAHTPGLFHLEPRPDFTRRKPKAKERHHDRPSSAQSGNSALESLRDS